MNDESIILQLFEQLHSYSFQKKELPSNISEKHIARLKKRGIIHQEFIPPSQCEECGHHAEYMEENGNLIIKCDLGHIVETPKDEYIVYRIALSDALLVLLKNLLGDFKLLTETSDGDFCKLKLERGGKPLDIIFSMDYSFSEERLFKILSPHIPRKDFIIFIFKDTEENHETIDTILQKIPLGNIIFNLPLSDIQNKKIKEELNEWLNYSSQIAELEENILENIGNTELKYLTASIDTNPKYILSALLRLKICKASKSSAKRKWEEMEHIVSAVFHSLYISDIRYGGTKQKGKPVFDNLFFIKGKEGIKIAGIVDCKYSMDADLSKEKTEKYEKYFQLVRGSPWLIPKKALIFVVLDTKSNYTIQEFYRRIKSKLGKGEYVIILPINSLEILMRVYLGVILKSKINIKKTDFAELLETIFDDDLLDKKETKLENGLYCIKPIFILDELKRRVESSSSIETAFEEIFK